MVACFVDLVVDADCFVDLTVELSLLFCSEVFAVVFVLGMDDCCTGWDIFVVERFSSPPIWKCSCWLTANPGLRFFGVDVDSCNADGPAASVVGREFDFAGSFLT